MMEFEGGDPPPRVAPDMEIEEKDEVTRLRERVSYLEGREAYLQGRVNSLKVWNAGLLTAFRRTDAHAKQLEAVVAQCRNAVASPLLRSEFSDEQWKALGTEVFPEHDEQEEN
jgi:hypothetical protein